VGRLHHPRIARVLEIGVDGTIPYVAMERAEGSDLLTLMELGDLQTPEWKVRVFTQICDGLAYAHRHLVVHLGLRPSNIYVTPEGDVKILAFGTAPLRTASGAKVELSAEEASCLAPEPLPGFAGDHRADIYAAGAIAYWLFAGRPPSIDASGGEWSPPVRQAGPDRAALPRTQYSPRLEAIVMRAMAPEVDRRYQRIDQALCDLENLVRNTALLFFDRIVEDIESPTAATAAGGWAKRPQAKNEEIERLFGLALAQAADGCLEEALKLTKAIRRLAPRDPRNDEMLAYLLVEAGAADATALSHLDPPVRLEMLEEAVVHPHPRTAR
jgi:serine/threonine protein kinase